MIITFVIEKTKQTFGIRICGAEPLSALIQRICEHINSYHFDNNVLLFIVYRGNVLKIDTELALESAFQNNRYPFINVVVNERSLEDIVFVPIIEYIPIVSDSE